MNISPLPTRLDILKEIQQVNSCASIASPFHHNIEVKKQKQRETNLIISFCINFYSFSFLFIIIQVISQAVNC